MDFLRSRQSLPVEFHDPYRSGIKHDPPVYRRLMNQRIRVRITLIRMLVVKGK